MHAYVVDFCFSGIHICQSRVPSQEQFYNFLFFGLFIGWYPQLIYNETSYVLTMG
jgi:hypothetical protein